VVQLCPNDNTNVFCVFIGGGGGGKSGTVGGRSPDTSLGFYLKEAFQSQTNTKGIIHQESLGTDLLQELMNSNYTRYHIELINRSGGG